MIVKAYSNNLERVVTRWLGYLGQAERLISFTAFMVLIGVVFGDVVSREVTGTGIHWARAAGVYANLFVVMFGIGLASAGGVHLRPRFADHWLPARWEPVLLRTQDGCMALFCLGFAAVAIGVVAESFLLGDRSVVLRILIWPFQAVIPTVFVLAFFRHAAFALFPALRPPDPSWGG